MKKISEAARLLVVSQDSEVLHPLRILGEANCWQFEKATSAWEALERVQSEATPNLLLLDLPAGDGDGLHILRWLRRLRPELPVILIGHPEDEERKQEAMRMGAWDYLVRPLDERQLETIIWRQLTESWKAAEPDITSEDVEVMDDDSFFIGISPVMRKLRAQAALLAEADVSILILGEGGSGKETTARLVHKLSVRSGFEFAKVNCAALPSAFLERELFGYQRNGITKQGKLEICERGTVFLDEITEIPIEVQANLLRVLQSKRFIRPDTSDSIEVDVRILAASAENIELAISEKKLREDLYYWLSAYTIHVPPLRERKDELALLSRHFMHRLAKHYSLTPRDFTPATFRACEAYGWPGNLRELESFVKRYLVAGESELVSESFQLSAAGGSQEMKLYLSDAQAWENTNTSESLRTVVRSLKLEAEKKAITAALEKTGWNRKAAAKLLKISYRALLYKIEQYQIKSLDSPSLASRVGVKGKGWGYRSNGQKD